jgi:hypothetical protein
MLDFLKPPTDNLYKFQSLAGLILLLFCLSYPPWLFHRALVAKFDADRRVAELRVEAAIAQDRRDVIRDRFDGNEKKKNHLEQKIHELENASASSKSKDTLAEIEKLQKSFDEAILVSEKLVDSFYEWDLAYARKTIQITHQQKMSDSELWISRLIVIVAAFVGLFGIILSLFGFRQWKTYVQLPRDEILRKQAAASPKSEDLAEQDQD